MFAYVRFRDDNEKRIVPVAACKHLKPNDTSDFNPRKWYKVFWKDETHCDHYHAQVIRPYATEDDAGKATEKRTSIPQRPGSDSSYSCSSNEVDGSFEERQAAVKQKMKDVSSHFKKKQRDLLFGDAEGGKKTEKELLKEEVNMLKAENSKLLDRIRMLEKALCSKIFKTEKNLVLCEGCSRKPEQQVAPLPSPCAATHHHHAAAAHRYRAATAHHHSDPGQP
ncbi:uncharacterized protein LOC119374776 [Rhipicephalus sanguineus]|uniref:uncharacterized protein LOC119374776 n=1 Tax=Rhipicephalus sanguineus TaxID=34632 RepID=UPI0018936E3F|nr:uncharacterized protein LOC119374776 [Rhipicephalus sanguineus]